jgi:hypothetical protein
VNFFDADGLSGEDCAEVNFFPVPKQMRPQRVTTMVLSQNDPRTVSSAKPKLTAFAAVNGKPAGSDTKPFPRK